MSNDPLRITLDKLAELLREFGLDPVDLKTLKLVHMEGGTIEIVRYRTDEKGQMVVLPGANEVATETVTIALVSR